MIKETGLTVIAGTLVLDVECVLPDSRKRL